MAFDYSWDWADIFCWWAKACTHVQFEDKRYKKWSLHLNKYITPKYLARLPAHSWCRNKQCWNAYCIWPDGKNTIPGISCISNLLPTILLGETHAVTFISESQKVRVNCIPVVPGRLDPPAEGKKKNLSWNAGAKHTLNISTVLIISWDSHWNHWGIIQNTLIKKNNTGTLNYSLWLRVKSLMITWTDMNWVWEKEKEREQ